MKKIFAVVALLFALSLPSAAQTQPYKLYIGGFHSHTSFSDGKLTPEIAWDVARKEAKVDFWAITDHYQSLDNVKGIPGVPPGTTEWKHTIKIAQEKTENGKFVAIPGWEWADSAYGHMNVLFDTTTPPAVLMTSFYDRFVNVWLKKHPKAITGFNHPFWSFGRKLNNFRSYEMIPEIASQTVYIEVSEIGDLGFYYAVLDKGWRIAPVGAQDNHSPDWGKRPEFAGLYATELTSAALLEALVARRSYATIDRNMKLWFEANGTPLGGELKASDVEFKINVTRTDGAPAAIVRLISNGGNVVASWQPQTAEFTATHKMNVKAKDETRWFIAFAEMADGRFTVSAPIRISTP